ncbi:MAG: DUF2877 domain-containing protein [Anaerolineae bacterium]|nr:DUF2877 domain-containing protein [Anaerolineae bacterium]
MLAGFSRTAYLVTEQAELFWLASEDAPRHVRGLRIAGPFPKLVAGENFFIQDQCINIAPHLQVDFGDASTWAVSPIPAEAALEIDQIPVRVKGIFSTGFDLSQANGFGRLIPRILSLAAGQLDDEAEIDPVLALAWPGIYEIARACLLRDMPGLLQEANALVGLGEGLTPSGDDLLGGLLFCVNTIQRLYPGFIDLDSSEKALFIESAKQRTHLISFTLLKDLTNGQAVEPLHELLHSVLSDRPSDTIGPASCLTRIGHSTGWDLLTGALTGLLLTFPGPDWIDSSAISPTQAVYA